MVCFYTRPVDIMQSLLEKKKVITFPPICKIFLSNLQNLETSNKIVVKSET